MDFWGLSAGFLLDLLAWGLRIVNFVGFAVYVSVDMGFGSLSIGFSNVYHHCSLGFLLICIIY